VAIDTPSAFRRFGDQDPVRSASVASPARGGDDAGKFPDNAQPLAADQHADVREYINPDASCQRLPLEQLIIFGAPRAGSYTCAHETARISHAFTAPPAQR
jgi:hypothetical protein